MDKEGKKLTSVDETRSAIIYAALEEFANRSVEGARTREIAKKANVNHAAINYHFGSKHEMYLKIVSDVLAHFEKKFTPQQEEIAAFIKSENKSQKQALELIKMIVSFNSEYFNDSRFLNFIAIIKREESFPSEGFNIVYEKGIKPRHQNVCKLIDIATNGKYSKKELSLIALSLMGMNYSLISCRLPYLRLTNQTSLAKHDIEFFNNFISESIDKIFK